MTTELATIEQKEVAFYGDQIIAARASDDGIYIPLRPICELLGIAWQGQNQRVNRDPILSEVCVNVTLTQVGDDQRRAVKCVPLDYLNGWLFGINAMRVKPEAKEQVLRYQRDCYRILADAFKNGELSTDNDDLSDVAAIDPEAAEALAIAEAVVKLARSHVRLIRQVSQNTSRVDSAETRLDALEATLGNPDRLITQPQQMEITQAVKAVAHELGQRSGRNEFGGVYGELYRRFEIASYKQLPSAKHDEALKFLADWYSRITGSELPF